MQNNNFRSVSFTPFPLKIVYLATTNVPFSGETITHKVIGKTLIHWPQQKDNACM